MFSSNFESKSSPKILPTRATYEPMCARCAVTTRGERDVAARRRPPGTAPSANHRRPQDDSSPAFANRAISPSPCQILAGQPRGAEHERTSSARHRRPVPACLHMPPLPGHRRSTQLCHEPTLTSPAPPRRIVAIKGHSPSSPTLHPSTFSPSVEHHGHPSAKLPLLRHTKAAQALLHTTRALSYLPEPFPSLLRRHLRWRRSTRAAPGASPSSTAAGPPPPSTPQRKPHW